MRGVRQKRLLGLMAPMGQRGTVMNGDEAKNSFLCEVLVKQVTFTHRR